MNYSDFSSWPRDQEQAFVVYEQRANESSRSAMIGGLIAAIAVFVIAVGIYAGVEPDKRDITKDMNMSNLTKKERKTAPAPPPSQPATTDQKPADQAAPAPAPSTPPASDQK